MSDATLSTLPATTQTRREDATEAFLSRYDGATRSMYAVDLRIFFDWCATADLDPMEARRTDLEAFTRHLIDERGNAISSTRRRLQTVRGFYTLAHADELIARNPSVMMRVPRLQRDPGRLVWLDRFQLGSLIRTASEATPAHHALVALMAMLGLRVSAACRARIEDVTVDSSGGRHLRVLEKNPRIHTTRVPGEVWEILQAAIGDRTEGPIVLRRNGTEQDRAGAYRWIRALAEKAGLPKNIHPHSLRRSIIAILLDSGERAEDVQRFAGHADIRTTLGTYHPEGGAKGVHSSFVAVAALTNVA